MQPLRDVASVSGIENCHQPHVATRQILSQAATVHEGNPGIRDGDECIVQKIANARLVYMATMHTRESRQAVSFFGTIELPACS